MLKKKKIINRNMKPGLGLANTHKIPNKSAFWKAGRWVLWNEDTFIGFPNITFYSRMLQKVNFNMKTCHDVLEECVKSQGCREACKYLWASQQEAQVEQAPPLGHGKRLGHTAHPLPSLSTSVNETLIFQPFPPTCKQCNKSGIKTHVWSQESNRVIWMKVKVSALSREAE